MQVVKTVVKLIFLLKSQFADKDIAELNLFKKQNETVLPHKAGVAWISLLCLSNAKKDVSHRQTET